MKIVVVGAGSREFGPATVRDILLSDALCREDLQVTLMDISADALVVTRQYAMHVNALLNRAVAFDTSTELDEALKGADAVVSAIEIKRYPFWAMDFHVPRKHGFTQIYGENGGAGGLFHALRNMKPMMELAKRMEEICPDALLLNYTNPLTKLSEALVRLSSIKSVGLCHGVFEGMKQVSRFLEMPVDDLDARACGLNHITWFQSLHHKKTGEDLYPRLKERERDAHWLAEWDEIGLSRILYRTFGLFPSPGANHIGEYISWSKDFLASQHLQFFYDPADGEPWETGKTPTWVYNLDDRPTEVPYYPDKPLVRVQPPREGPLPTSRDEVIPSGELAIPILEGLFCNEAQFLDAINIRNTGGLVPGLPEDAVVEVPATVDEEGLHPQQMEALPEGVNAILRTQCSINALLVEAFAYRDRDPLLQALLIDPTCPSYRNAVHFLDEMLKLQGEIIGWD